MRQNALVCSGCAVRFPWRPDFTTKACPRCGSRLKRLDSANPSGQPPAGARVAAQRTSDGRWQSQVAAFLKELWKEMVEEFWLPAVGIGLLVVLASVGVLIWAGTMYSRDSVWLFDRWVSCEYVREGSATVGGRLVGAFSAQVKAAQDQCNEASLSQLLRTAGGILLPVGLLWTAAWGYGGYRYEIASP